MNSFFSSARKNLRVLSNDSSFFALDKILCFIKSILSSFVLASQNISSSIFSVGFGFISRRFLYKSSAFFHKLSLNLIYSINSSFIIIFHLSSLSTKLSIEASIILRVDLLINVSFCSSFIQTNFLILFILIPSNINSLGIAIVVHCLIKSGF
ncbi:MAG: hypothetical protein U9Q66_03650 [Patescibacteria group bacterium]|nr:hypothetical protein [Patescibacteria group bacterium]